MERAVTAHTLALPDPRDLPPSGDLPGGLAQTMPSAQPLPPLREDLILFPAADNRDGSPAWMIHDPVVNRFYRIGWLEFEMLSRWQDSGSALLARLNAETTLAADAQSLAALLQFLEQNFLLRADTPQASARLAAMAESHSRRDLRWLLHHYLYIRIPLVRPDRWLAAALPYVRFIYTRAFALLVLALSVTGLVLASRQWDEFLVSFQDSFTPSGVLAYMAALAFVKVMHELGHAFTATRYGVRVAHMGLALVVMFPMLYTDTSESWKLTDHRKRLAIVAAGMTTEIGIAALSTLCWSLVDDGVLRSAFFFLATTSWVLSLAINASPFMRFDGYFVLSDLLDIPNLHMRCFAFGRRFLRNWLLGWHEPLPEILPRRTERFLTVFAFVVWLYRLTVFAGIAVGVYLYFFKALGIFLFCVEISWFILLPIYSEFRVWWRRRSEIVLRRRLIALGLLLAVGAFVFVPLRHGVHAPGWVRAGSTQALYAPFPARVSHIHPAGPVRAGEVLLTLESPDTRAKRTQAEAASATVWSQLRHADVTEQGTAQRGLLGSRLRQEQAEALSATQEVERLELVAPFSGTLTDLDPLVHAGVWVNTRQELGMLVSGRTWYAEAFVDQDGLQHVRIGDPARVYVPDSFEPLLARVVEIDSARTVTLPNPMLDAAHGGSIRVSTANDKHEVEHALYRVRMRLESAPRSQRSESAKIVIEGGRYSLGAHWLRALAGVIIRQSGF